MTWSHGHNDHSFQFTAFSLSHFLALSFCCFTQNNFQQSISFERKKPTFAVYIFLYSIRVRVCLWQKLTTLIMIFVMSSNSKHRKIIELRTLHEQQNKLSFECYERIINMQLEHLVRHYSQVDWHWTKSCMHFHSNDCWTFNLRIKSHKIKLSIESKASGFQFNKHHCKMLTRGF